MKGHEQSASTSSSASILLPRTGVKHSDAGKESPVSGNLFTKKSVKRVHCPDEKSEVFFWDAGTPGFGLRALKSGRRSWIYQYRDRHGRTRRIAIGDESKVSLDAARKMARKHAEEVAQGGNPSAERKAKRGASKVSELVDAYLDHAARRQRPRSFQETERHLRRHATPLHHEVVDAVRRRNVASLLEDVAEESGPIAANRLRAALSAMWTWGLRTGRIEGEINPVSFTIVRPEKARDRTLTDSEIRAIWSATDGDGDYSRIVRLLLLTGCRRDEIGSLRWDEVKEDRIVIASDRMMGEMANEIPILPLISAALPDRPDNADGSVFGRRGTGFSGWSKSKAAIDAKLEKAIGPLPRWTLHDLRRTFSTRLHDAGVEPIVVESLLAHKQQGVAAVYNRATLWEAKREALYRWHSLLESIIPYFQKK